MTYRSRQGRPPGVVVSAIVLAWAACCAAQAPGATPFSDATPADATPLPAAPAQASPGDARSLSPVTGATLDAMGLPRCALLHPASETALSSSCLGCHGTLAHGGHPYDFAYPKWGSPGGMLRPVAEVTRRGLSLPEGQVRCTTCHERGSPWKYRLKLPPGATPTHAVDLTRPVTYESPRSLPPPRAGDDIGRKPLCLACHALD